MTDSSPTSVAQVPRWRSTEPTVDARNNVWNAGREIEQGYDPGVEWAPINAAARGIRKRLVETQGSVPRAPMGGMTFTGKMTPSGPLYRPGTSGSARNLEAAPEPLPRYQYMGEPDAPDYVCGEVRRRFESFSFADWPDHVDELKPLNDAACAVLDYMREHDGPPLVGAAWDAKRGGLTRPEAS